MWRRFFAASVVVAVLSGIATASDMAARPRPSVVVKSSSFGRILFDGRGFVLYGFTRDGRRGKSTCTGSCARAWPPYTVKSRPRAGSGIAASRLGTIRRADGRLQLTYFKRPLYYYVGDKRPGQILCQNVAEFGGSWRVVRPSGLLVK
jgi:predicted lipoprotein with Yx(FWY)xxD motif